MLQRPFQNRILLLVACLLLLLISLSVYHRERLIDTTSRPQEQLNLEQENKITPEEPPPHPPWQYKSQETDKPNLPPVVDNFPSFATPLPPVPAWNQPSVHGDAPTPLLIGFTRNWRILQQAVVSYIAAGWPAEDIYVVENTGVMDNNKNSKLGLQNPFFLNHTRLELLGVNILRTSTLLNFAQLQNFYLNFAVERNLKGYFWSHMDVIALSDETKDLSIYARAVDTYHDYFSRSDDKWAAIWFAYDRLVLVNTAAYLDLGGWDTFIGYYMTDCDFHERLMMKEYHMPDGDVGFIYDVGRSVDDLDVFYRRDAEKNDQGYRDLIAQCDRIQADKNSDERGRNFWQERQLGGMGDPFYRDPQAFEDAILLAIEQGRGMFAEKWGHRGCDLRGSGLKLGDEWKVVKDW